MVGKITRRGGESTTQVESWNGTEWSVQEGPRPAESATLNGVSCPTVISCTTTGFKWVTDEGYEHTIPWGEYSDQPVRGGAHVEAQLPVLGPSGFATLKAKVYPGELATSYQFEYGTTTAYGKKAPVSPKSIGSGSEPVEVSEIISGLSPNTAYHYRVVAENSVGAVQSPDQEFSTGVVPANISLPVISPATPAQAVPVSTTNGKWSGGPTSYAYQWKRCNASGGECSVLKGATESTYTPTSTDAGSTLVVEVTAKNSEGSASVNTVPTAKVKAIGSIAEYALPAGSEPTEIASGPDGNLWFTASSTDKIGKITTTGTITEYALPYNRYPVGIASGPDGKLWFANSNSSTIGKITTTGTITEYALAAGSRPAGIVSGPDGNLWFAEEGASKIGRITTSGTVTTYSLPAESRPYGMAAGPDGMVWFTTLSSSKIGTIAP